MRVKEAFSKIVPYLDAWSRVEGLILIVVAVGILLPLGGRADVVIAICICIWGSKKLLFGG